MKVSWDDELPKYSQLIWENKHVPNHQPPQKKLDGPMNRPRHEVRGVRLRCDVTAEARSLMMTLSGDILRPVGLWTGAVKET